MARRRELVVPDIEGTNFVEISREDDLPQTCNDQIEIVVGTVVLRLPEGMGVSRIATLVSALKDA